MGEFMADLITLSCPNCGGDLKFTPGTVSFTCQHCGREHLIRNDAGGIFIESFARCPKCGRNDRVEKILVILADQTYRLKGVTVEKRDYKGEDGKVYSENVSVPFTGTQSSLLAQKLEMPKPPAAPSNATGFLNFLALVAFGGSLFLLYCAWIYVGYYSSGLYSTTFLEPIFFGILFILCILAGLRLLKAAKKETATYAHNLDEYNHSLEEWKMKQEKWKRFYYCFRDDCVFDPDEKIAIDSRELQDYLKVEGK